MKLQVLVAFLGLAAVWAEPPPPYPPAGAPGSSGAPSGQNGFAPPAARVSLDLFRSHKIGGPSSGDDQPEERPPSSYGPPSPKSYGPPSGSHNGHGAPKSSYGPPSQNGQSAPKNSYGPPTSSHNGHSAPRSSYGPPAPQNGHSAPKSTYGPPRNSPESSYGPPQINGNSFYNSAENELDGSSFSMASSSSYKTHSGANGHSYKDQMGNGKSGHHSYPSQDMTSYTSRNQGMQHHHNSQGSRSYQAPQPSYGPPSSSYGPPSSSYGPPGLSAKSASEDAMQEPVNYEFLYDVDSRDGAEFGHKETREEEAAWGSYHVLLPDGRTQIVEYTADDRGFRPKISYKEPENDLDQRSGPY